MNLTFEIAITSGQLSRLLNPTIVQELLFGVAFLHCLLDISVITSAVIQQAHFI
jgi:hypothetical protein